jgi:predicted ATPase
VQNLFESASESGGDAYRTLEEVGKDLHLLLFDPDRFLFDRETQSTDKMQLHFKKGKLYGRDEEETLITDIFCRVTRGNSEAFFIGGFSGSGKSMLVDTLRVNVKNVGGYVIKHKFDAMSQDRPLSGIISALNQLCLMIKKRLSPRHLTVLSEKLKDDFGDDIDLLARMLPNICLLSPQNTALSVGVEDEDTSDKMNPRSVSFTLLRFVRLVSSPRNPIMVSASSISESCLAL